MTDRRRAAARRVREIASKLRTRSKLGREESTRAILQVTGQLADLAEKTAAQAAAVLRNGRRAIPKAISGRVRGRLRRIWLCKCAARYGCACPPAERACSATNG